MENPYQQSDSDANNFNAYNQQQLDSNYESSNYVETSTANDVQNPSNYANDSVYYDYVGAQNQNYSTDVQPQQQTMYDDQNYQQQDDAYGGGGSDEYFQYQQQQQQQPDDGIMYQVQSNENNYDDISRQMDIETSNETNVDEYQAPNINTTDTAEMSLENANYAVGNETIDDGSDVSQAQEQPSVIVSENAVASTKHEDIKMVKQLLDSESSDDPNSARSNLLQTAIKEESGESDFDFSGSK